MPKTRNVASFDADLPDDTERDEEDRVVVPRGKGLAHLVRAHLVGEGWSCSEPSQYSFYGWAFLIATSGRATRVIVQYVDEWVLVVTREASFWKKIRGIPDDQVEPSLLGDIDSALVEEKGVSNVEWHTREDYL